MSLRYPVRDVVIPWLPRRARASRLTAGWCCYPRPGRAPCRVAVWPPGPAWPHPRAVRGPAGCAPCGAGCRRSAPACPLGACADAGSGAAGSGDFWAPDAGLDQNAAHRGTAQVDALALPQQLGEVAVVCPGEPLLASLTTAAAAVSGTALCGFRPRFPWTNAAGPPLR